MTSHKQMSHQQVPDQLRSRAALAAAMGVELWVARKPLPGARDGHAVLGLAPLQSQKENPDQREAPSPVATSRQAGSGSMPVASRPATGAGAARAALLGGTGDVSGVPRSSHAQRTTNANPALANAGQHDTKTLQFEVACARFGALMVVDDVSMLNATPSAYQSWLAAIAIAAGEQAGLPQKGANGSQPARISWPPAMQPPGSRATAPQAQRAAADMLSAWLRRQCSEAPARGRIERVLLMGTAPALLAGAGQETTGEMPLQEPFDGASTLVTHSSAELWQKPVLKRALWSQLLRWRE